MKRKERNPQPRNKKALVVTLKEKLSNETQTHIDKVAMVVQHAS